MALILLLCIVAAICGARLSPGARLSRRMVSDYQRGYRANHGHVFQRISDRRRVRMGAWR